MKFNIKKFKKNIPFFIISCIVIMIILILSLIENNKTLPEEDLNNPIKNDNNSITIDTIIN